MPLSKMSIRKRSGIVCVTLGMILLAMAVPLLLTADYSQTSGRFPLPVGVVLVGSTVFAVITFIYGLVLLVRERRNGSR